MLRKKKMWLKKYVLLTQLSQRVVEAYCDIGGGPILPVTQLSLASSTHSCARRAH